MKVTIVFLLVFAAGVKADDDALEKVAVCAVLRNPVRWNGKMIEVAGPIISPPEDSFWVMGVGCDGVLEIKGTKFPSGFVFEDPSNNRTHYHIVNFSWDRQSKDELDSFVREARRTKQRVIATVVGLFETLDPIDGLINNDAPVKYQGFGHMGGAPAQIIVRTVKNLRIEARDPSLKK